MSAAQQPEAEHRRAGIPWTGRELVVVRNLYPTHGLRGVRKMLPHRSPAAIYKQAMRFGLLSPQQAKIGPRRLWTYNEHIDAAIRKAYTLGKVGAVRDCASTLGRPIPAIGARALTLGCIVPKFRQAPWTPPEDEILREYAHMHPATVARMLARTGYSRPPSAVSVRIRRLRLSTLDPNIYSAASLSDVLGIHRTVVTRWCDKGMIQCKREGNTIKIHRRDIRRFVIENVAAIDFRKVDKWWLVELLAGYDPE